MQKKDVVIGVSGIASFFVAAAYNFLTCPSPRVALATTVLAITGLLVGTNKFAPFRETIRELNDFGL